MGQACPICGDPGAIEAYGRIAPFIRELSSDPRSAARDTALRHCDNCDLAYFSHRFDADTLDAMYSGYRDDRYLSIRRSWEPWYSRKTNSATKPGSDAAAERTGFMTEVVAAHADIEDFRNIVDYGGDEGQFFPTGYAGRKYVIEVSGKNLVEGVKAASTLDELPDRPHLVIAAHLLEHLVDPLALVSEIRAAVADDGLFYVEVPLDRPKVRPWHSGPQYRRFLKWVSASRFSWVAADFATGVARNFGRTVPRYGTVKQSEHINYFSTRSLRTLLTRGGFRIVGTASDPTASVGGLRMGRLGALAVPA